LHLRSAKHLVIPHVHPTEIDGRTLVVIRARRSLLGGYDVVESGMLEHDGEVLHLVGDHGSRAVTDAELGSLQPVVQQSIISVCRGFDFFLLRPANAG
jgi:hypothetical protein